MLLAGVCRTHEHGPGQRYHGAGDAMSCAVDKPQRFFRPGLVEKEEVTANDVEWARDEHRLWEQVSEGFFTGKCQLQNLLGLDNGFRDGHEVGFDLRV